MNKNDLITFFDERIKTSNKNIQECYLVQAKFLGITSKSKQEKFLKTMLLNSNKSYDKYKKIINYLSNEEFALIPKYNNNYERCKKLLDRDKKIIDKNNKIMNKSSNEEFALIAKYKNYGNDTFKYYTLMLEIILARKRLDIFVSGNLSNYKKNYNSKIKKLQDDINNFIEDEEHTIILPMRKIDLHRKIKSSLTDYLTFVSIKRFLNSLEKLYI